MNLARLVGIKQKPRTIEGTVEAVAHRYNPIVGNHSLMIIGRIGNLGDVLPVIFYDKDGEIQTGNEIQDGDRVSVTIMPNRGVTGEQKTTIGSYLPVGFKPSFYVRKISSSAEPLAA